MVRNPSTSVAENENRERVWKESHVPLLYDWISSRKLCWPNAAVQWGDSVPDDANSARRGAVFVDDVPNYTTRALYLAERTGDSTDPNTLLYFDARITIENTARADEVATPWLDETVVNARSDGMSTPEFWLRKRVVHPGEVNRIRCVLPGVVVTHTDSPELFVWDFAHLPNREKNAPKNDTSIPTCTLIGHSRNAEYALSVAGPGGDDAMSADAWIASGGADRKVLLWRLADYETMGKDIKSWVSLGGKSGVKGSVLGHAATIEDVSFNGHDRNLIASVARDSALLFWDVRQATRPTGFVRGAHRGDVNACDFGGADMDLLISGGSDMVARVWDRRKLVDSNGGAKPVSEHAEHTGQIQAIMWNKHVRNVFATCAEDGLVLVWDTALASTGRLEAANSCLLFRHVGHAIHGEESTVVDMDWLPDENDPWCIGSISEMVGDSGGSTLQMWRMSSLVHSPRETVASELQALSS